MQPSVLNLNHLLKMSGRYLGENEVQTVPNLQVFLPLQGDLRITLIVPRDLNKSVASIQKSEGALICLNY